MTGVEAADGLYHRVWASNGPGRLALLYDIHATQWIIINTSYHQHQ
jgi:hypothetical protein